jgi:EmrB/QacA subfamily drug resistance transporter
MTTGLAEESGASPDTSFDAGLIRIAVVIVLGTVMTIVDSTIVNVAIPTLGRDLKASLPTIQWTSTSYLLALATIIPITRWVIERIGAKNAYLLSLVLFLSGSICCGLAWSATSLIVFRAVQGIGGGMLLPVGQTILTRVAGPHRMGRVMSLVGAPSMLGVVIGPVVGGVVLVTLGWRWIFFINIPIGLIGIVLAAIFIPRDDERSRPPFDTIGLLLLPPGLALLMYGFTEFGNVGHVSTAVLVGLVGGPVLIGCFVWRSLRTRHPLLNLRLFANRRFATANIAALVFIAASGSGPLITTLYYQIGRGYSPLGSGLYQCAWAFGGALGMPFAGRIIDRSGPRKIAIVGMLIYVASNVPWLFLTPTTDMAGLTATLFIRGLGSGFVTTPLMAAGYAALARTQMPTATTLSNIAQRFGQAAGVAFIAVVVQRSIARGLPARFSTLSTIPLAGPNRRFVIRPLAHVFVIASWASMIVIAFALVGALMLPGTAATADGPLRTTGPVNVEEPSAGTGPAPLTSRNP